MKIGILINSFKVTRFYKNLIDELSLIVGIELYFIVLNRKVTYSKKNILFSQIPFAMYMRLERKLSPVKNYPLDTVVLDKNLAKEIFIFENIHSNNYSELSETDINLLKQINFDILFRVGWGIIKGQVLNIANNGIWSLHHGDNDYYRGKPALFWEYYEKKEMVGAILQQLSDKLDGGTIIDKLYTKVNKYYITKGYHDVYYKSLEMVLDNIKYLIEHNDTKSYSYDFRIYSNKIYKDPNIFQQFNLIIQLTFKNVFRLFNKSKMNWEILIAFSRNKELIYRYKTIKNKKGFFSADPFLFENENKNYIFYEEAPLKSGFGHISYLNCEEHNDRGIALKESFHLSFPNIFKDNGIIYMIPETRNSNSIRLYKCDQFPNKWLFDKTLLENISTTDSEIFFNKGVYYLFTNVNKNKYLTNADCLYLYFSDTLKGEYLPHPQNPITRDARFSRMGGKVFTINNINYRVAQNETNGYGSGISILKINKINKEEYSEKLVQTIEASSIKKDRFHTFNFNNKYSVIDAIR